MAGRYYRLGEMSDKGRQQLIAVNDHVSAFMTLAI